MWAIKKTIISIFDIFLEYIQAENEINSSYIAVDAPVCHDFAAIWTIILDLWLDGFVGYDKIFPYLWGFRIKTSEIC